jgi:hypothetical protein
MAEVVAEYIDRLCTVEMRSPGNLPRGVTHRLYNAAREAQQAHPLTFQAAMALRSRLAPGRRVLFVTGAGGPPYVPHGETDGPLGTVALARAIAVGFEANPVFVLEERHIRPVVAAATAAGLTVVENDPQAATPGTAIVAPFPCGMEEGRLAARDLLHEHRPQAVVFVEKLGPNHRGVVHSVAGYHRDLNTIGSAFWLAEEARAQGILTVAVGDNGNEIGFGKIVDTVRAVLPYGHRCQCPCGAGVACVSETDVLVVSAISNWGAYGIAACLGYLERDLALLQDEHTEQQMLEACVRHGAVDGALGRAVLSVDGAPMQVQLAFLTMLRGIVTSGLRTIDRPF